jgi:hypothetical protein
MNVNNAINDLSCIYYNYSLLIVESEKYRIDCDIKRLKSKQKKSLQYLIWLQRFTDCDLPLCDIEDFIDKVKKNKVYTCYVDSNCKNIITTVCDLNITEIIDFDQCFEIPITEIE